KLLAWWVGENGKGRHVWPGNIPSRVTGTDKGWPAEEIVNQVQATRAQKGATGNVHFSMKALLHNPGGVADALKTVYAEPALVPASPWLGDKPPAAPRVEWQEQSGKAALRIKPAGEGVRLVVVRSQAGGKWSTRIQPATQETIAVAFETRPDKVWVSAVDRV